MNDRTRRRAAAGSSLVLCVACANIGALAGGLPGVTLESDAKLEEVVIQAQRTGLLGEVRSASQGTVTRLQLETRPVLRTGELLETVPGS